MKYSQNHTEVLLLRKLSYCREKVYNKGTKDIDVV